MAEYALAQIDAFAEAPLLGNPCAVVHEADAIDPAVMQAVAREMNLSETAFVLRSEVADVRARYFTPAAEIPLAGHPTIATIFSLVTSGRVALEGECTTIALELEAGVIPVEVLRRPGRPLLITMSQKRPEFARTYDAADVLPAFGLEPGDLLEGATIQTVSTGTPQLMIPLEGLDALRRVTPDMRRCAEFKDSGDFFSPHLFVLEGATPRGATFARHFGLPPDTFEDPFTGSATGGMAAYLWRHGLIDSPSFVAEQGHWMNRPGSAQVEVVGDRDAIETVRVGGTAVTVVEGTLRL